jgi:hypothetical protein
MDFSKGSPQNKSFTLLLGLKLVTGSDILVCLAFYRGSPGFRAVSSSLVRPQAEP